MATRKSAGKKKKSPKKRKPKVKLDNRKVMALAAVMIFFCAVVLAVTFAVSAPESKKVSSSPSHNVEKKLEVKKPVSAKKEKVPVAKETKKPVAAPVQERKTEVKKSPEPEQKKIVRTEQKQEEKIVSKPASKPSAKPERKLEEKKVSVSVSQPEKKEKPVAPKFNIPQAANGARLCFIIDDGGQKTSNIRKYTTLPFPIAVAVLPRLECTKECARIVVADRKELMLHQPMQAQNLKMNPGPGAIEPEMSLNEIKNLVVQNLVELGPHVKGMNNHEGSLITCDEMKMGAVLDVAAQRGVYFVDSRTSKDTMVPIAALERDMKILEREVFIDDIIDRGEMLKQIMRGIDIANKKGKVVMIGHVDKSAKILPALLSEMYPELKAKGYRLVFPSQLL